mmetsp:Transcript_32423/g.82601  ORF Transcript_32423/g.82601 Transcript_32423/m.82601 type:complete len:252 (-) Transcript_32423:662-1417(-)
MLLHRPLLFLQVGKHIVLHLVGELGDGQLDEGQHGARVARADLVQLLTELLVAHVAGAVLVQHLEDALQLIPLNVHEREQVLEARDGLVGVQQLREVQQAGLVGIHLLAVAEELQLLLLPVGLLLRHLRLAVLLARVLCALDDDGQDQVHEPQGDGDHDAYHDERHLRVFLDHRDGDEAPAVACDNLLEEREVRVHDRGEGPGAARARHYVPGQHGVDGVDMLHQDDGPERQQAEEHEAGEEQGLHGAQQS